MKQILISPMAPEKLIRTKAHQLYAQTALPPNQRFMNLINNAYEAVVACKTVPRNQYGHRLHDFDIKNECLINTEFHASLICANLMLANKTSGERVLPDIKLADCHDFSPLDYAIALKEYKRPEQPYARGPFYSLGRYFEKQLDDYQQVLDFGLQKVHLTKLPPLIRRRPGGKAIPGWWLDY